MSAFFRSDGKSPYLLVSPTVPGFGRVGPWSTKTRDRRRAEAMESMLIELPMLGHAEIIRMIQRGEVTLPEVYVAKLEGKLEALKAKANDPPLSEVIAGFTTKDERVKSGLNELGRLAPDERLSHLKDPKNVLTVLERREAEGLKRNSVRRSLYRAITDLLAKELGTTARDAIMREVRFPTEKDEREVDLSADDIGRLLDGCDVMFRQFVGLALSSGMDRAPILRIRPKHFDEAEGTLRVYDQKTEARARTLQLSDAAQGYLRRAMILAKAGPDDLVFPWTVWQVRKRFDGARGKAGLDHVRLKDLRSVFATAMTGVGAPLKLVQVLLGHASEKTSLRYTKAQAIEARATLNAAAEKMGLSRHLGVAEETA